MKPADQQLLLYTIGEMAGLNWVSSTEEIVIEHKQASHSHVDGDGLWQELHAIATQGAVIELDDWVERNRDIPLPPALEVHLRQLNFAEIAAFAQSQIDRFI